MICFAGRNHQLEAGLTGALRLARPLIRVSIVGWIGWRGDSPVSLGGKGVGEARDGGQRGMLAVATVAWGVFPYATCCAGHARLCPIYLSREHERNMEL